MSETQPCFVIAQLSPTRSLPNFSTQELRQTVESLPTYPFLALSVFGRHLRFLNPGGREISNDLRSRVDDWLFILPVLPYPPAGSLEGCCLELATPSTHPSKRRRINVYPPLSHPDGRTLYLHTYLRLLVRPPSTMTKEIYHLPTQDQLSPFVVASDSMDILAHSVAEDVARYNFLAYSYHRWSGGSDIVEPTWSTFSVTVGERIGTSELFGCQYDFLPFDKLDWVKLDSQPTNIYHQLSYFYQ